MVGARILDGAAIAASILDDVSARTASLTARKGVRPCLATVLVGDDPASAVYVRSKRATCERVGFESRHHALPADIEQDELLATVWALAEDASVHGILVQLPLPKHLDATSVIDTIPLAKDVDGFHPGSLGNLGLKRPGFTPCTPAGVMRMLREAGVDPAGKRAVVVGRSAIVGLPVSLLLLHAHATVTIVHSRTKEADLVDALRGADIVVAAVGIARFVRGAWLKEGAVVIDVGINRVDAGDGKTRLVGDVDFDEALPRVAAISPVPGGVGKMTIAMLMANTLQAAEQAAG